MYRPFVFLLLATLLPLITLGQDLNTKTFSLKEAQDQAVKNNAQVQLALLDVGIAKQTVRNVTAIGMPQIGATGSFNHYIAIPTSVVPADAFGFPDWFNQWIDDVAESTTITPNYPSGSDQEFSELQFGSKYSSSFGITVNQLIFDGSFIIGLRAAKSFVKVQNQALSRTETEVKLTLTRSYYGVLIAEQNAEILGKNLLSIQKTYEESKELLNNGFIEQIALDQVKLLVGNLEISHNTAKEQLEISGKLLNYQMGLPLGTEISLSEDLNSLASISSEFAVDNEFNLEEHLDFKMAQTQVQLMELNKKKEQFAYLPTLGGFFNHQRNAFRNEFDFMSGNWYPTTLWGLSLNIPIFGGFGQAAQLRIAGMQLEKAQIRQSQISDRLKLSEASRKLAFTSAMSLYLNQKENLELAKTIREKTAIKFKEGLASSMELAQAENQFFSTQGAYVQSVFSLLNAKTELQKALGQL